MQGHKENTEGSLYKALGIRQPRITQYCQTTESIESKTQGRTTDGPNHEALCKPQ